MMYNALVIDMNNLANVIFYARNYSVFEENIDLKATVNFFKK